MKGKRKMTYRIIWKYLVTNMLYTEYGTIEKVKYLTEWLEEHSDDYQLISVEIDDAE